jgi:hypothetical protein
MDLRGISLLGVSTAILQAQPLFDTFLVGAQHAVPGASAWLDAAHLPPPSVLFGKLRAVTLPLP